MGDVIYINEWKQKRDDKIRNDYITNIFVSDWMFLSFDDISLLESYLIDDGEDEYPSPPDNVA